MNQTYGQLPAATIFASRTTRPRPTNLSFAATAARRWKNHRTQWSPSMSELPEVRSTDPVLDMYDHHERRRRTMNGWRSIDTAPHDGMHIIVANFSIGSIGYGYFRQCREPVPFMTVAHYWSNPGEEGFYLSAGASSEIDDSPLRVTHWRPLPEPLSTGFAGSGV